MNNRERLKLIIENWFIEKTSIKLTDDGLNNLVDRIYYDKQLIIGGDSKSLPTKKYEIDFGGNLMAGIEIIGESISVFGAMNGYGYGIDEDRIKITER